MRLLYYVVMSRWYLVPFPDLCIEILGMGLGSTWKQLRLGTRLTRNPETKKQNPMSKSPQTMLCSLVLRLESQ